MELGNLEIWWCMSIIYSAVDRYSRLVCQPVYTLYPGSATFSLSRAALAVHMFVDGRRKKLIMS
jgi:hypothetical protein